MPLTGKKGKLLLTLFAIVFFAGAAVIDQLARARGAWRQGERCSAWQSDPALKQRYFDELYLKKADKLKRTAPAASLKKALEGLETEKRFRLNESSAKYAYFWYRTASEDFCRPRNRWCLMARAKAAPAKEAWKSELRAKNIRFEDWMLE
jgi:hypothetical protein